MKKKKKGFTLIEVISVIAILGITMMLTYTLFSKAYTVFNKAEQESLMLDEARNFSSILEEDMRLASDVQINITIPVSYGISSTAVGLVKITNDSAEEYIYTKEGNKIVKYKVSPSPVKKMSTLANNVIDVSISAIGTKSYKLGIKSNRKGIENFFETVVTRRMI